MVHALNEIHRVLTDDGQLVDLRPITGERQLELVGPSDHLRIGPFERLAVDPDDAAADGAVRTAIRDGLFHREKDGSFLFAYYWDTVDEMKAYVDERWSYTTLPPETEQEARRVMTAGPGRLRCLITVKISRMRKLSDASHK